MTSLFVQVELAKALEVCPVCGERTAIERRVNLHGDDVARVVHDGHFATAYELIRRA